MRRQALSFILCALIAAAFLLSPRGTFAQLEQPGNSKTDAELDYYTIEDIAGLEEPPLLITDELQQPDDFDPDSVIQTLFQQQAPAVPQQQTPQAVPQPAA